MASLDEIVHLYRVERREVITWIDEGWLRPQSTIPGDAAFDAVDEARIALICDLRYGMQIDHDAVGIILSLIDELHTVRHALRTVGQAVASLPEPLRRQVTDCLAAKPDCD